MKSTSVDMIVFFYEFVSQQMKIAVLFMLRLALREFHNKLKSYYYSFFFFWYLSGLTKILAYVLDLYILCCGLCIQARPLSILISTRQTKMYVGINILLKRSPIVTAILPKIIG
jgi:hypothetical protein